MTDENPSGQQEPQNPGLKTLVPEPTAEAMPADPVPARSVPAPVGKPAPAFSLGERLSRQERHPVLLFGTLASGKSSILMSLIANLRESREVSVSLGEPIYPSDHSRHKETDDFSHDLFERKNDSFVRGREMLGTTEVRYPLFIPIDIQPSRDIETGPVKFAFLEGRGDWYLPTAGSEGRLFQDFKDEVVDVLKFYDGGLTAIFVAPYTNPDNAQSLRDNDLGLMGALEAYYTHRKRKEQDGLLYLLTKWDTYADPVENPKFGEMEASDVVEVMNRLYAISWPRFQQMPRSLRNDRRFFMQYCAGYLVDEMHRPPPPDRKSVFQRYPRTLLNWLYGNATREVKADGVVEERVLFADVVDRGRVRFWKRVTDFVLVR